MEAHRINRFDDLSISDAWDTHCGNVTDDVVVIDDPNAIHIIGGAKPLFFYPIKNEVSVVEQGLHSIENSHRIFWGMPQSA